MNRVGDLPVIVVGSGPTAAAAAVALVDRGVPVVMLESGAARPRGIVVRVAGHPVVRKLPSGSITRRGRHRSLSDDADWWQSLSLGGLSNHWTSAVPRFAPEDFTDGGRLDPALAWPITYDELVPHYEAIERELDITAAADAFPQLPPGVARYRRAIPPDWRSVADAARRRGHGLTTMPMAVGRRWMAAGRGTEFNSFASMIQPISGSPGFELRRNAHVCEVLPPDAGGRPGVRYRSVATGTVETLRGAAVVLAAGALASTRLLLASRSVDAPNGLGNGRGLVGTHLHDHPKAWWTFRTSHPLTLPPHVLYLTRGAYGDAPLSGRSWTIGLARSADRVRRYARGRGRWFGVQVFGTTVPTAENRVVLLDERDDLGDAKLGISIRYADAERALVGESDRPLVDVFGQAGIEVEPDGAIEVDPPGSSVHFGGTARMHVDPAWGVLDPWNRLHEMPEILVVDASCFTTGPEKNPTLTAMALARRAASRLADEITGDPEPTALPPSRG